MEEKITVSGVPQYFERHTLATPDGVAAGNAANPLIISSVTAATGGNTTYINTSLSGTAAAVKGSAGIVKNFSCYNPNASIVFLQFFDTAQGSTTPGVTAPVASYAIPASGWYDFDPGAQHLTAITIAATTTVNGGTAPAAGIVVNINRS